MPKAVLFINGEMVRQRGIPAPRRHSLTNWQKHLCKSFERDLKEFAGLRLAICEPLKVMVSEEEIRMSLPGGVAFLVDRVQDALA